MKAQNQTLDTKVKQIPTTNWPEQSGEYKVVQIDLDGQPHLRFQTKKDTTHANILLRWIMVENQTFDYQTIKDLQDSDVPALEWTLEGGCAYKVRGMGNAKINVENRRASFYGISTGYGLCIDRQHLDSIQPSVPNWKFEYGGE